MNRVILIVALLLGLTLHSHADERIFYQPLNVDASLTQAQWRQVWQDSAKQGVHTVIVQWTAYGDSRFGDAQGWLVNSLRLANEQGLKVVLGLYMDPEYFQRIDQLDSAGLASYWQAQLGQSLAQQRKIRQDWKLPVSGWYMPMELDDFHFLALNRRQELQRQLKDFAAKLDAPLHLSAFSAGKLAPQVNGEWLAELASSGIQVWWQDGAGTNQLPPLVRDTYASALPCSVGIVREAFRQVSGKNQPFRAEPASLVASTSSCHLSAVFSLRYRPWGKPILDNQLRTKAKDARSH
jgi:hypothetical protein